MASGKALYLKKNCNYFERGNGLSENAHSTCSIVKWPLIRPFAAIS